MLSGFTILHLRFSLEISNRNIKYKSYGQYGALSESYLCGAKREPLTQNSMNMDFWINGIFHEMFVIRKQNGGQNNSTILCNMPFENM